VTLEEIRASGLLELYALGQLSAREHETVQRALHDLPELKKDLQEIERTLENYAQTARINAPAGVRERVLQEVGSDKTGSTRSKNNSSGTGWRIAALISGLIAIALLYLLMQRNKELSINEGRLTVVTDSCRQQSQRLLAQIETLQQLTRQENQILHMAGTEKYPETDLYFHHNSFTQRNFIQVRNLPALAANQSFQLWSIKPGVDPIPLDVFQTPMNPIIEVRHVDASQAYAITIEPLGGQSAPTLENLIGIVNVSG
jgi:anti-sigma-K factor RskA